jgi:hypothetical protein
MLTNFSDSTNSLVGRVYSKVHDEEACCCEMGPVGLCLCFSLIPLGVYTPSGGFGFFCCLSNCLRRQFIQKYQMAGDDVILPWYCDLCLHGVCYPCNFYQLLMTAKYYEEADRTTHYSVKSGPSDMANPMNTR